MIRSDPESRLWLWIAALELRYIIAIAPGQNMLARGAHVGPSASGRLRASAAHRSGGACKGSGGLAVFFSATGDRKSVV